MEEQEEITNKIFVKRKNCIVQLRKEALQDLTNMLENDTVE